jgi:NitT/TauT family transport system ATP-binding protein
LVFEDFTFTVGRGEITAVCGPSGVGKSTLLALVSGEESPASGEVSAAGPVSHLFQDEVCLPWRTALENVLLPFDLRRAGSERCGRKREEASAALAELGLEGAAAKYPAELSGGMAQRVLLARALVQGARLFLFDEALSAIDPGLRQRVVWSLRRKVRELGSTALFVSHQIGDAVAIADRLIVLRGSPANILADLRINLSEEERRPHDLCRSGSFVEYCQSVLSLLGSGDLL